MLVVGVVVVEDCRVFYVECRWWPYSWYLPISLSFLLLRREDSLPFPLHICSTHLEILISFRVSFLMESNFTFYYPLGKATKVHLLFCDIARILVPLFLSFSCSNCLSQPHLSHRLSDGSTKVLLISPSQKLLNLSENRNDVFTVLFKNLHLKS